MFASPLSRWLGGQRAEEERLRGLVDSPDSEAQRQLAAESARAIRLQRRVAELEEALLDLGVITPHAQPASSSGTSRTGSKWRRALARASSGGAVATAARRIRRTSTVQHRRVLSILNAYDTSGDHKLSEADFGDLLHKIVNKLELLPPQPRCRGLAVAIVQAPVHDGNDALAGRQGREEAKGGPHGWCAVPLRCPGHPPPAQLLETAKSDVRAWSLSSGRGFARAVDDRVRDVCYENRPVVAGGAKL